MRHRILVALAAVLVLALALFLLGPRVSFDTTITFDAADIGPDPETWLAASEAEIDGIREGLEKEIVWADPRSRRRTELSIVYVHGFSASKGEVRPLPDRLAEELDANLFYTRLAGHGRGGEAMAGASVKAWVNDMAEAMEIGRRIGERVVVIGTSTGGTLATWAAARPELARNMAGAVLISPNYGLQAGGVDILTMPWGGPVAKLVLGRERGFEPLNERHGEYWTTSYPTEALLPMAALVRLVRDMDVGDIPVPALFAYSKADTIVRPDITAEVAERWGAAHETLLVAESGDPFNHVIAGDVLSPGNTDALVRDIAAWIRTLPR